MFSVFSTFQVLRWQPKPAACQCVNEQASGSSQGCQPDVRIVPVESMRAEAQEAGPVGAPGQCGRRLAAQQQVTIPLNIGPDIHKNTIPVYPDVVHHQERCLVRFTYILDTIFAYPDIVPDIVGDVVIFFTRYRRFSDIVSVKKK
jgi:hypothetical protein